MAYLQWSGSDRHWQAMIGTGWQRRIKHSPIHTENIMRPSLSPGKGERYTSSHDHGPVAAQPTL
jgi:hypothetical protein